MKKMLFAFVGLSFVGCAGFQLRSSKVPLQETVVPELTDNQALHAPHGTRFVSDKTFYVLVQRRQHGEKTVVSFSYDTSSSQRSRGGFECLHELGTVERTYNRRGWNINTRFVTGRRFTTPGLCVY